MSDTYDWADDPDLSSEAILERFRELPLVSCGLDPNGCQHCGYPFSFAATRGICPQCHQKNTCCE